MIHPRKAIVDAIKAALQSGSPALPAYLEDETATQQPCFQIADGTEQPGDDGTKSSRDRLLTVKVTARGRTLEERETLAYVLELALLESAISEAFEILPLGVEMSRDGEGGQRTLSATYSLAVSYSYPRG